MCGRPLEPQLLHGLSQPLFIRPDAAIEHAATIVQQVTRRVHLYTVVTEDRAVPPGPAHHDGKREALLSDILVDYLRRVGTIDRDQVEPFAFETAIELLKARKLRAADRSPVEPEVDQGSWTALQGISQRNRTAARHG
jgi:hypothetical protein